MIGKSCAAHGELVSCRKKNEFDASKEVTKGSLKNAI